MNKKVVGILICFMLVSVSFIYTSKESIVKASDEKSTGTDKVDYGFIYEVILDLSNIIFGEHGSDNKIFKGRDFGSVGEREAATLIHSWMDGNTDNLSVLNLTLERIGDDNYGYNPLDPMRVFNNKMETLGYGLSFRNATSGPPNSVIPRNETFPFPCYMLAAEENISCDDYYVLEWYSEETNNYIQGTAPLTLDPYNITRYNISYILLNTSGLIIDGEVTSIANYSNVTVNETAGKIHLINASDSEFNDTVDILQECNASGFILLRDDISNIQNWSLNVSGVAVSSENGSMLKNLTLNGSLFAFPPLNDSFQSTGLLEFFHIENVATCPFFEKKIYLINSSWLKPNLNWARFVRQNKLRPKCCPSRCAGFIFYDSSQPDTHFHYPFSITNTIPNSYSRLRVPAMSINGSINVDGQMKQFEQWVKDNEDTDHPVRAKFWINQKKNSIAESYNVFCDIQGEDQSKNFMFSGGHYDGWWGQMTIDNAVGTAQMLGILKYINDNNLTPKYNLRFIAHGGEEYSRRGSLSHVFNQSNFGVLNSTEYMINLCQLAHIFKNSSFRINTSDLDYISILSTIIADSQYNERYADTNHRARIGGELSTYVDAYPYYSQESRTKIKIDHINFCTNNFSSYHLSGNDHTLGDTPAVLDRENLNLTTDIIWNFTKYMVINPDCCFESVTYDAFDSLNDGDTLDDSVNVSFEINSSLPHDKVMVKAYLKKYSNSKASVTTSLYSTTNYTVTSSNVNDWFIFTIPDNESKRDYAFELKLYNSTGRVNEAVGIGGSGNNDDTSTSDVFSLYHPFGYTSSGSLSQIVHNKIVGSTFVANEYGLAQNITIRIPQNFESPPGAPKYKCMIYRANDSKRIGVTEEIDLSGKSIVKQWLALNFTSPPTIIKDVEYVLTAWGSKSSAKIYYNIFVDPRGRYQNYTYGIQPPDPADFTNESRLYLIYCSYTPDTAPPEITNVTSIPVDTGYYDTDHEYYTNITADVTDDLSDVNKVKVAVDYPNNTLMGNYTMNIGAGDTFWYNLSMMNTPYGIYNYTIWVEDNANNTNISGQYNFTVSICGDANGDGSCNIGDSVYLIAYVYQSGPPPDPLCSGDANGDGSVDVGDSVYIIAFVYQSGDPPKNTCCPLD